MRNSILETSKIHVDEVRNINQDLAEKSFRIRCMAYLAEVKAKLLTNTIYNMGDSKKALKTVNSELTTTIDKMYIMRQTISDQKDALHEKNKQLEALSQQKSTFIALMSHELRTPLNAIIGLSDILMRETDGQLNQSQKDKVEMVSDAGKHLQALIDDIIDLSRIETYKAVPEIEKFDVYNIVQKTVNLLKKEAEQKGLTLKVDSAHLDINSDKQRLTQCLINLIGNAIKYTETGTISVNSCIKKGNESEMLEISVSDTGIGIEEKDMPLLFSTFTRLNTPFKSHVTGTGLGLYLTKKLTKEVLRGDVAVTSVHGQGSTFKLTIPTSIS